MITINQILENLKEGSFKGSIDEVECPVCKKANENGILEYDDEIKGVICNNCEEQFFNKKLIKQVTGE